jgi:Uma2 family endonuclease
MSAQPPARLTEEEYLEIERATEFRNEYYDGHMYVMSGGSATHAFIIGNLMGALHNALREKPCRIASSDFRVRVPPERFYTYPDIVVVCDPIQLFQKDTLLNPVLLIEVLSPSTESRDRGFKFDRYRAIDSLQEYALVSQFEPHVEVFRRHEAGKWLFSVFKGLETTCTFESIGVTVPLSEIYRKVEFENEPAAGQKD